MNKGLCLILGADGFIGSYLTEALLKSGYSIRAFDKFLKGNINFLNHIIDKIEIFEGDFLRKKDIDKALENVEYVFHYISTTIPANSINKPIFDVNTNIISTLRLLQLCLKHNVKKVIFSSSGGTIYGGSDKDKYNEYDLTNPITPYGIQKLIIEKYLNYFKYQYGLEYMICRYSNPYGPRQGVGGKQGIIPIFLNLIKQDKPVQIFGDGKNVRDYIYIKDCIEATIRLFEKEKLLYTLYNIGSGKGVSINEIINIVKKITNKNIDIISLPPRSSDVKKVILDISRVECELGKVENTNLYDGIKLVWKYTLEH